jgi:hypothetical protein
MQECGNITEPEADLLTRELQAGDQALGRIIGRRRRLDGACLARRLIEDLDIG